MEKDKIAVRIFRCTIATPAAKPQCEQTVKAKTCFSHSFLDVVIAFTLVTDVELHKTVPGIHPFALTQGGGRLTRDSRGADVVQCHPYMYTYGGGSS